MSTETDYTVKLFIQDRRTKTGERHYRTVEFKQMTDDTVEHAISLLVATLLSEKPRAKYRVEKHKTYHEVKNLMTGKIVKERFDTPWHCSVASESYWAM